MNVSKSVLSGLAAMLMANFGVSVAHADGMERQVYNPAIATGYNWSGAYVGGSVGWARTSTDWTYTHPSPPTCCASVSDDSNNGIAGVHVGLQHQFGSFVLGIEGALSGKSMFDAGFEGSAGCIIGDTRGCVTKMGNIATIGGRLGYAMNNTLFFIGGGYARTDIESRLTTFDSGSARHDGWYIGGGLEYALTPNVIVGLEYQHISFDSVEHQPSSGLANFRDIDADVDVVRARLSFKFGRETFVSSAPLK